MIIIIMMMIIIIKQTNKNVRGIGKRREREKEKKVFKPSFFNEFSGSILGMCSNQFEVGA